jgi:uroporphyrinogen decarboxylase
MKEAAQAAAPAVFLRTLAGAPTAPPPVWLMRQAGRYLPEYRATRARAGSFLDLCLNPALACDVTLQPIRRYDFDAAILFSDILVVPMAMGQRLSFPEGEGPRLDPVVTPANLDAFGRENIRDRLAPVLETARRVRSALAPEKALIGFAGAPWTVATYMLAGRPSDDPSAWRRLYYSDRPFLTALIEALTEHTVEYLIAQIDAGANALQLFDTWAGGLPEAVLRAVSLEPMAKIGAAVKAARPGTPILLFPRGVGAAAADYAALAACDAISIDAATPWDWARATLAPKAVVQGGFDPMLVVAGGEPMEREARRLVRAFSGTPYIFNLGHGITPDAPPENVARLVAAIRGG